MGMSQKMKAELLEAAGKEMEGLLKDHSEEILDAFEESYEDHCEQKAQGLIKEKARFKYPVSLKVLIQPVKGAQDTRVSAKIAWGITHTDESDGTVVSDQAELAPGIGKGRKGRSKT